MSDIISSITLCNVPISPSNQIDFKDVTAQQEYFNSKKVVTYDNCKYTPRNSKLRVKGYVDSLNQCNYGYYVNTYNGVTKTYYFWIVEKNLLVKEVTELTIQIDTFQTWQFDITFNQCMIAREHVEDDTFGLHTIPEDFELGDYVTVEQIKVDKLTGDLAYFIAITDPDENLIGSVYGKKYSGFTLKYYSQSDLGQLTTYITNLCNAGKADAIAFIFVLPKNMLSTEISSSMESGSIISSSRGVIDETVTIKPFTQLFRFKDKDYTPKNNKLFCYPFNYMTITSPNGSNVVLKYELFNNGLYGTYFKIEGVLAQNSKFTLTPNNYAGRTWSYEDSIELGGFGLCSWNNDNYANWYANNQNSLRAQSKNAYQSAKANQDVNSNNYDTSLLNSGISLASGLASGAAQMFSFGGLNIGGGLSTMANAGTNYAQSMISANNTLSNSKLMNKTSYESTMRSLLASVNDSAVQPNTCKGDTSACGLDVARDTNTFFINQTMIKPEYAKMIDQYFQMYGYKVNRLGVPNFKKRLLWDYIQTVNCNVSGNIPYEDKADIEEQFNNGITVWHNINYMFDYLRDNTIQ